MFSYESNTCARWKMYQTVHKGIMWKVNIHFPEKAVKRVFCGLFHTFLWYKSKYFTYVIFLNYYMHINNDCSLILQVLLLRGKWQECTFLLLEVRCVYVTYLGQCNVTRVKGGTFRWKHLRCHYVSSTSFGICWSQESRVRTRWGRDLHRHVMDIAWARNKPCLKILRFWY